MVSGISDMDFSISLKKINKYLVKLERVRWSKPWTNSGQGHMNMMIRLRNVWMLLLLLIMICAGATVKTVILCTMRDRELLVLFLQINCFNQVYCYLYSLQNAFYSKGPLSAGTKTLNKNPFKSGKSCALYFMKCVPNISSHRDIHLFLCIHTLSYTI